VTVDTGRLERNLSRGCGQRGPLTAVTAVFVTAADCLAWHLPSDWLGMRPIDLQIAAV